MHHFASFWKKNRFFHGFIILYLKFWLHRFYIQNAAECSILRPSELEKKDPPLPLLVSRGLAYMHNVATIYWDNLYKPNTRISPKEVLFRQVLQYTKLHCINLVYPSSWNNVVEFSKQIYLQFPFLIIQKLWNYTSTFTLQLYPFAG